MILVLSFFSLLFQENNTYFLARLLVIIIKKFKI